VKCRRDQLTLFLSHSRLDLRPHLQYILSPFSDPLFILLDLSDYRSLYSLLLSLTVNIIVFAMWQAAQWQASNGKVGLLNWMGDHFTTSWANISAGRKCVRLSVTLPVNSLGLDNLFKESRKRELAAVPRSDRFEADSSCLFTSRLVPL
jgi:hypothetical protein